MSAKILVVDDHEIAASACTKILRRAGYQAHGETKSLAALTRLKEETFDILLTDVRMPEMDGMELLTQARALDPRLSIVVVTGFGTIDDAIKAIRLGAQGFILKPYEPDELLAIVKENLQRRSSLQDQVRLQTLLPLLKLSEAIQDSEGASGLVEQALQVAAKELNLDTIHLWVEPAANSLMPLAGIARSAMPNPFSPVQIAQVINNGLALWQTASGQLSWGEAEARRAMALCLPVRFKGETLAALTATLPAHQLPLGQFELELLQVLSGQLAIALNNINLFNHVETLRVFNENIIENISAGLIALDARGIITVFNKAASALLGLSAVAVVDRPVEQALAEFPQLIGPVSESLASRQLCLKRDIELTSQDKSLLTVTVTSAPVYNNQRRLTGVVSLIEDQTEQKMLETERRLLDRLVALGEMSAVVAHELRNPIAGIAAGVNYLSKKIPPDSPDYQAGQMIMREVERVHRIIEDILLVARPMELQTEPETLQNILDSVLRQYQPAFKEANIIASLDPADNLPLVQLDRTRIEQVLTNLIDNAIQAMPQGGTINISAKKDKEKEQIQLYIKDTGPGIPAANRQKIFEPFYTTKSRGTGLGLALSRQIIEAHQGRIDILNSDEQGATFEISLPAI